MLTWFYTVFGLAFIGLSVLNFFQVLGPLALAALGVLLLASGMVFALVQWERTERQLQACQATIRHMTGMPLQEDGR